MSGFAAALALAVDLEGAFSKDPRDPGNWTGGAVGSGTLKGTKCGISAAAYPSLDIEHLTADRISEIYLVDYWQRMGCEQLPPALALAVFAFAVNEGQPTAARILQRVVGATQDGVVGIATIAKACALEITYVVSSFIADCALHYVGCKGFVTDGRGWLRRSAETALQAGRLLP